MTVAANELARRRRRGIELQGRAGERAAAVVLGSFNLDLLPPYLLEATDRAGIDVDVHVGEFGQVARAALDPSSRLYELRPRTVLLVPAVEDLLAPVFDGTIAAGTAQADELADLRLGELRDGVRAILERLPDATCHVVVFGSQRVAAEHVLDPRAPQRGQQLVERFLAGIRELGALSPRVVLVDWEWQVRAIGTAALADERLWYLARMRLSPLGTATLAELCARSMAAYRGPAAKIVAVDLDDTLWGGVVGEVGLAGLQLGEEGIGLAFQDVQRELLKLRASGVLLAACSKNNRADAVEVFERHPAMVLRLEHFAAERINWSDKASSLREIAAELELGLDAFVLLDDNPVERGWVRRTLPEVIVPELPGDPTLRPSFVRSLQLFDRLRTTDADQQRAASYDARRERAQVREDSPSIESYLRSLEQVVTIEAVHEGSLARSAQLCQRTNQFNLTSRRHTAADIERMTNAAEFELYTLALRDRFGDSGITGLAILAFAGDSAEIDTYLLSCRILGRRIEDALLAFLAGRARARGARTLVGLRSATARNAQTAGFYVDRGFELAGDGIHHLDLEARELPYPDEVHVEAPAHA